MIRRGRTPAILALGLGIAAIGGCAPEPAAPAARGPGGSFAALWASRRLVLGPAGDAPGVDVRFGARVVRHDGIERTTVSEVLDLSSLETGDLAPGECSDPVTAASLEDVGRAEGGVFVELVDVGDIEVRGAGPIRLEPRTFPDLLSVVSGVVYTGDARDDVLGAGAEVTFAARGGGGIGPLEATSTVPDEIAGLRVGRQDPWLGAPALARGADLEVVWDAAGAGDEVRVELAWMEPAGPVVVSCHARDEGRFVVPSSRTRLVPELASADPTLTVRRLRRAPVLASGLDDGSLVVEQSVTFEVTGRAAGF